jgi:hypothetical protein
MKTPKQYKGKIPFRARNGDLLSYPGSDYERDETTGKYRPVDPEWRDNYQFHARLKVVDVSRGRSAARFVLEDLGGTKYEMFMIDILKLTERGIDPGGYVTGDWTFCKRGSNYGITPAE